MKMTKLNNTGTSIDHLQKIKLHPIHISKTPWKFKQSRKANEDMEMVFNEAGNVVVIVVVRDKEEEKEQL